MKKLPFKLHLYFDYLSVAIFALMPVVLGLSGNAAILSYVLAAVHLAVTILTLKNVITPKIHQWIEFAVGPVLLVSPYVLNFADHSTPRVSFMILGAVLLIVAINTKYQHEKI